MALRSQHYWSHSSQGCCQQIMTNWTSQIFQSYLILQKMQIYLLKMFQTEESQDCRTELADGGKWQQPSAGFYHPLLQPWDRQFSEFKKGAKGKGIWGRDPSWPLTDCVCKQVESLYLGGCSSKTRRERDSRTLSFHPLPVKEPCPAEQFKCLYRHAMEGNQVSWLKQTNNKKNTHDFPDGPVARNPCS